MKKVFVSLLVCILLNSFSLSSQKQTKEKGLDAITLESIKGQLEFLSSDWTEGREVGKKGAFMAADYIASMFKVYGLKPAGDDAWIYPSRAERMKGKKSEKYRSYFQNISFIEYTPGEKQFLTLKTQKKGLNKSINLNYKTDFSLRVSDIAQELEAPVVFVGYGMKDDTNNYDDFKGVDIKGKIIIRIYGYPGHKDTNSVAYKKFKPEGRWPMWSLNKKKNELAESLGALAVININPDANYELNWAQNTPFRYNSTMWEGNRKQKSYYDTRLKLPGKEISSQLININLSKRAINELIKDDNINIESFETVAKNQNKTDSKALKGKSIFLKTTVNSKIIKCRNVVGVLEGKNPDEIIVIGGHYDHLGIHDGFIWNGADDNASGTVGVMTIAKAFLASGVQPEKTIVFAAWTGEEKGLHGSKYFVQNPYNPDGKIVLNLNYDMISRDNSDDSLGVQCTMNYTKGYEKLEELAVKHNEEYKLDLDITFRSSKRPSGGSDHASFSKEDIPIFYFMAGFPLDYHQPSDQIEKVNWGKMLKIIKLGYLNIWELANSKSDIGK